MMKKRINSLFMIIGVTAIIVGPLLLLYAYMEQGTITKFKNHGIETEATITGKERNSKYSYDVGVSFTTGSILEDGKVIITDIHELLPGKIWTEINVGDQTEVLYLAEDPEEQVVLKASTESHYLAPIQQYKLGFTSSMIGFVSLFLNKYIKPSSRK